MSDGILSEDEIDHLLNGTYADDSVSSEEELTKHKTVLSQDEVDQLLKTIVAGAPLNVKAFKMLEEYLTKSKNASKTKHTPILSQDEINQLLKAIPADDP
jgi:flagellar motor switch protein FliM